MFIPMYYAIIQSLKPLDELWNYPPKFYVVYLHFASFGALQTFHGFVVGDYLSNESGIVYFNNPVASHQTDFFGRSSRYDTVDMDGVFLNGELDTYATKTSSQVGIDRFQIFGWNIG